MRVKPRVEAKSLVAAAIGLLALLLSLYLHYTAAAGGPDP